MGFLKRIKENTAGSPKTTKKGAIYSIVAAGVGLVGMLIGRKLPGLGELIIGNEEEIASVIIAIATAIFGRFAAKKD